MADLVRETREWVDDFKRPITLATTPEAGTGWTKKITEATANTTFATAANGTGLVVTFAATSEIKIATVYHNNIILYDIDKLLTVEWVAKLTGMAAACSIVIGMAGVQNDVLDDIAQNVWFRAEGTAAWKGESDDGTTDVDDAAAESSVAQSTAFKKFTIDFTGTPGNAGKKDIKLYVSDVNGRQTRIKATSAFNMNAYTAGLQPFVQMQKTAAADAPVLTLGQFRIRYLNEW